MGDLGLFSHYWASSAGRIFSSIDPVEDFGMAALNICHRVSHCTKIQIGPTISQSAMGYSGILCLEKFGEGGDFSGLPSRKTQGLSAS